jgi:hypothetical protein
MNEQTELLREMRDLLLVLAEPALAKRDEKFRESLRTIVGRSKPKIKAIQLMDGSRTQGQIGKEAVLDAGNLSRFVKLLREAGLIGKDEKQNLKLVISVPPSFFEEGK